MEEQSKVEFIAKEHMHCMSYWTSISIKLVCRAASILDLNWIKIDFYLFIKLLSNLDEII